MNLRDSHEWVLWQAREAIGEPHEKPVPVVVVPPPVVSRRKRTKHWAGSFQIKFCHWLKGDGERPCDLGYTRRELMRHLERQFTKGMTWDNYALGGSFKARSWVVDHIVPKRLFDPADVREAYALSNLRPLWGQDNMSKSGTRVHLL